MNEVLLYTGSVVIFLWGLGHLVPTKPVVSSFNGARTSIIPMKLCPLIKTAVAVAIVLGAIL